MAYLFRLTAFLLVSLCSHLLFFQIGMPGKIDQQGQRRHGVGYVSRPAEQFIQSSEVARPAKPQLALARVSKTLPGELLLVPSASVVPEKKSAPARPAEGKGTPLKEKTAEAGTVPSVAPVEDVAESAVAQPGEPASVALPAEVVTERTGAESNLQFASTGTQVVGSLASGSPGTEQETGFHKALPRYDLNPLPRYPEVARRRGQQGTVQIEVLVLADGRVGDVKLVSSSGYKNLDRAARKAVKSWQFKPAVSLSGAVESRVVIPVDFVLNND